MFFIQVRLIVFIENKQFYQGSHVLFCSLELTFPEPTVSPFETQVIQSDLLPNELVGKP